jgi:hypothetical protein
MVAQLRVGRQREGRAAARNLVIAPGSDARVTPPGE